MKAITSGGYMFNKISRYIFNIIYLIVFTLSIFFSYKYLNVLKENTEVHAKQKQESEIVDEKEQYDLEYFKEYYSNKDIIGSIRIKDTNINNLLVKGRNNQYYLNHSLTKEYDEKGSIFLDYRTDLSSKQINIYGHNSNVYDLPFKDLERYLNKEFYDTHKYIEIWNGKETILYQIFSIQIITDDYYYMDINSKNKKDHINKLNMSIYETELKATIDDQILILQTCNYSPKNSLIIVVSKKVREV